MMQRCDTWKACVGVLQNRCRLGGSVGMHWCRLGGSCLVLGKTWWNLMMQRCDTCKACVVVLACIGAH